MKKDLNKFHLSSVFQFENLRQVFSNIIISIMIFKVFEFFLCFSYYIVMWLQFVLWAFFANSSTLTEDTGFLAVVAN